LWFTTPTDIGRPVTFPPLDYRRRRPPDPPVSCEHLRRAVAARHRLSWIARDPDLAALHGDPDFAALVAEIERKLEAERDEIRRIKATLELS
jgi:hypothetical protein